MSATQTTFTPTAEQEQILALVKTRADVAIEAGAGTGKTSTLVAVAEQESDRRGQYIVFNKAMADEAKLKFPETVSCRTAHSLAFGPCGSRFKRRIDARVRMRSSEVAEILGIRGMNVQTFTGERKWLSAAKLAGIAKATVIAFCQSGDAEITRYHVPLQKGLDRPGDRNRPAQRELAKYLVPFAEKIWRDGIDPNGILPYDHAYYLKLWERSSPRINADYILFDEAQDASPVMLSIIEQQPERVQRIFVGDSQQQIYSFTGAVNALGRIRERGGAVAFLTQSFRFGPAVAGVANGVLEELRAELRIVGFDAIESTVGDVEEPHAILTRTNAEAVRSLISALGREKRPHLVGGGDEILRFARGAEQLKAGEKADHPDLYLFDTWQQVVEYVEEDEQGGDLRLLVRLIDEFGTDKIIDALERMPAERDADVVISTAHKSKGREWDTVRLAGDFPADAGDEELRLLYVAVTRARLRLDVTALPTLAGPEPQDEPGGAEEPAHAPTGAVDGFGRAPAGSNGSAPAAEADDDEEAPATTYIVVADGDRLGEYATVRAAGSVGLLLHRGGAFKRVTVIDSNGELIADHES